MDAFTPLPALTGGILIGIAVSLLLLINGKICGISGIAGNLLTAPRKDSGWRLYFVLGLLAGGGVLTLAYPEASAFTVSTPWPLLILAGLLVGYGTRLGSGCTSGHGVCGLSRLSLRSLVATLSFMIAGFVTVFISRHLLGGG